MKVSDITVLPVETRALIGRLVAKVIAEGLAPFAGVAERLSTEVILPKGRLATALG